jgi:hypothetical protein
MKLTSLAQHIVLQSHVKFLLESAEGDAAVVQNQLFSLGAELKKDGEDITDDEVQSAMLSALIDADGKVNNVDASDIASIKKEIKESRGYINEAGILHSIEALGTVLGNAALLHALAEGLHKLGFKSINADKLKDKIETVISKIKIVTGYPAKVMEKAFSWIAKKLGFDTFVQEIAGIAGTVIATVILLSLAVYFFPSIKSVVLMIFAITGMVGKSTEIYTLIKKLIAHIKAHQQEIKAA